MCFLPGLVSIFELFVIFFFFFPFLSEHLCDAPERQPRLPDQRGGKAGRRKEGSRRERESEGDGGGVPGDGNAAVDLWDCG